MNKFNSQATPKIQSRLGHSSSAPLNVIAEDGGFAAMAFAQQLNNVRSPDESAGGQSPAAAIVSPSQKNYEGGEQSDSNQISSNEAGTPRATTTRLNTARSNCLLNTLETQKSLRSSEPNQTVKLNFASKNTKFDEHSYF